MRRKHEYLVGWQGDGQCRYGKKEEGAIRFVMPMTKFQAERYLRKMPVQKGSRTFPVLYRLIEMTPSAEQKGTE